MHKITVDWTSTGCESLADAQLSDDWPLLLAAPAAVQSELRNKNKIKLILKLPHFCNCKMRYEISGAKKWVRGTPVDMECPTAYSRGLACDGINGGRAVLPARPA